MHFVIIKKWLRYQIQFLLSSSACSFVSACHYIASCTAMYTWICCLNLKNDVHVHALLYDHIFKSQVLATVKNMALMHPVLMHTFKLSLLQWNEANQTICLHNLCSLKVDIYTLPFLLSIFSAKCKDCSNWGKNFISHTASFQVGTLFFLDIFFGYLIVGKNSNIVAKYVNTEMCLFLP